MNARNVKKKFNINTLICWNSEFGWIFSIVWSAWIILNLFENCLTEFSLHCFSAEIKLNLSFIWTNNLHWNHLKEQLVLLLSVLVIASVFKIVSCVEIFLSSLWVVQLSYELWFQLFPTILWLTKSSNKYNWKQFYSK